MTLSALLPKKMFLPAAFILAVSACGGGGSDATSRPKVDPTTTLTAEPTQAPSDEAPSFEPNVGDRALRVGQTRKGQAAKMTLAEVKYPYPPGEFNVPEEGKQFVGLRIRQCVSETFSPADYQGEDFYSTYNGEWAVATPGGNQVTGSGEYWNDWPNPKFPESVTMNAGDCLKGWVLLEVPPGTKVKKLIWRPGGTTTAEWLS